MADDNDTFGEGSNYFSSFKVGGVKQNIYGPSVKGVPNPGVRIEPKTDAQGKQLYDLDGQPSVNIIQQPAFIDGSDALANQGFTISFQSVINKKTTVFKAFVTAFNETYNSNWTSEEVYGRADPIYLFKNTTRNITLAFGVPASTEGEAYENLTKTQELIQKLYPAYTNVQRAQTIAQSPLVRMKVINLTQRAAGDYGANLGVSPQLMNVTPDASDGILGIISLLFLALYFLNLYLLYKFKNIGKQMYLFLFIFLSIYSLLLGTNAYDPIFYLLDGLGWAISGAILVFLYFTPIKKEFEK